MAVQCSCNTNETFLDLKKKRALQSNFNSNSLLPIFVIDNKFLNFSKPFFIQKTEILPPLWDGSIYKIMYINSLDQVLAYKNHRVILSFLPFLFPYGFSIKTTTKQEYLIFTYIIFFNLKSLYKYLIKVWKVNTSIHDLNNYFKKVAVSRCYTSNIAKDVKFLVLLNNIWNVDVYCIGSIEKFFLWSKTKAQKTPWNTRCMPQEESSSAKAYLRGFYLYHVLQKLRV